DWNLPPTVGVVDVDMPEVGLGPCPRPVLQRDERLAAIEPLLLEVTASRRGGGSRRRRTAPRIAGLVRRRKEGAGRKQAFGDRSRATRRRARQRCREPWRVASSARRASGRGNGRVR